MAAEDMSNKEIAQALFVTVKTVEQHLGRVYRKLDIGSRRAARRGARRPRRIRSACLRRARAPPGAPPFSAGAKDRGQEWGSPGRDDVTARLA